MRVTWSVLSVSGVLAAATEARADPPAFPTAMTVGLYAGTRVSPGVGLAGALDVDVYLDRARAVSLGPGVAVSVLGSESGHPEQQQDVLVAVDLVRFKLSLGSTGGALRPVFYGGFGFSYASLAAASVPATVVHAGGMTAGEVRHPALTEIAGMLTFGAGLDIFLSRHVALSVLGQPHFHLWGTSRIPDVWTELTLGLRVGL